VLADEPALARVREAVTGLVSGRSDVVLPVLGAAATGEQLDATTDATLRGLGRLVAESGSAAQVGAAVGAALRAGQAGAFAAEVAGAHVAVLEYGQRLQYVLAWSQAKATAVDVQMVWTIGISLPVALVPGPAGELAGAVEDLAADALNANGEVEIGPDKGVVRTGRDAARFAAQALGSADPDSAGAAARTGFDRTAEVLGRLRAPEESLLDRLGEISLPDVSRRPGHGR
jgi:hypothetical protein